MGHVVGHKVSLSGFSHVPAHSPLTKSLRFRKKEGGGGGDMTIFVLFS